MIMTQNPQRGSGRTDFYKSAKMKKLEDLRKKYPEFVYQGFEWKYLKPNLKIWFDFLIVPGLKFRTKILIKNVSKQRFEKINKTDLDCLIFHLGLIEMLNYWKATCSPIIRIEAGNLNKEQKLFLRKVILKGMGQYFYENKIDFTKPGFLKIKINKNKPFYKSSKIKLNQNKILIPIGGGKDAPVTIEFLKGRGRKLGSFVLNPKKPQLEITKIAGLKENIFVERKLDKKLFELNKKGYLNGHVPFSAFLSNLSLILALIFDYGKIAFSWEKSSSEPNLKYKGRWINHQWSKSLEFEKEFSKYSKKYLLKNVEVFSPLRNFSEFQIAEIFAKLPKYHFAFLSCNNAYKIGSKTIKWCGKCPKCLFIFVSLYPFLDEKKLIKIFGKNLFEDKSLLSTMLELIGEGKFKPFECVGTKKENILAFYLSSKKAKEKGRIPYLLKYFEEKILPKHLDIKIIKWARSVLAHFLIL
jgi:hypothetical protein